MAKGIGKRANPERKGQISAKKSAESTPDVVSAKSYPVVGIGASAGGLEAFTKLLQNLPADTGMAFVLIQHLDRTHESILANLLSRSTKMPVHEVTDRMRVEPNQVYVIPPNTDMRIENAMLRLTCRGKPGEQHMPVDHFFESLARSQKHQAIGVVLSGTASDGTAGLRVIKQEGGITFAQDQASARYDGMPRNAISANVVDFILSPEKIARALVNIGHHPYVGPHFAETAAELLPAGTSELNKVFALIRVKTGADFSAYKKGTIERRIRRRMVLRNTDKVADYIELLQANQAEVIALYEDLLINVTEFFRDPKIFEALKTDVFPKLIEDRPADSPIRIWVAGCSTGEEAYSIAMALIDFLEERETPIPVQIFATDISETAIGKARRGFYPESAIAKRVPGELFQRFFNKFDHGYRISKRIRDVCVFARQDITKDPPFSNVDLISCRNLLIYLDQSLQEKVAPVFHYALKPNGYLLLGSAESLGASHLFAPVDKTCKIYRKEPAGDGPALHFVAPSAGGAKFTGGAVEEPGIGHELQNEADGIVSAKYGPPGVIVDEHMKIVHFRGDVGPYLRPASRSASLDLLKMAREDMVTDLRATIDLARRTTVAVHRIGKGNFSLEIIPITRGGRERYFLVLFEATSPVQENLTAGARRKPAANGHGAAKEIDLLTAELASVKDHLRILIDERQVSEEELRSANEEILSSNEELQSTNEELETSQEELQSTNEELTTVNDELQHRNKLLSHLSNDLSNLLNSVNIPIVMLDNDLCVRHFTPMAGRVMNLRPGDVGRSIAEIKSNLEIGNLEALLARAVADLAPIEMDVQDRSGAWFSMRIRPYRTEENKIDGAVIVLYDVEQLKRSLLDLRQARDFSQAIVETIPGPLAILDAELRVTIANRAFYETFRLERQETEGRALSELAGGNWNFPQLREKLGLALAENRSFAELEIQCSLPRVGKKVLLMQGRRLDLGERRRILLLSVTDVTTQRLAEDRMRTSLKHAESSLRESEEDLRQSRGELRTLAARLLTTQEEERQRVSRELHDDLNQKLAMLEVDAERLGQQMRSPEEMSQGVRSLQGRVAELSNDIRRVAYQLHPSILDHLGLHVALRSYCAEVSKRDGIQVKFTGQEPPQPVPDEIALCLYRVTQEGLRNVAKHAAAKSAVVALSVEDHRIHLCIRDNGSGFDTSAKSKEGIGLLSMKERVRLVDGEFTLKSKVGEGTRIDIWAPLPQ